MPFCETCGSMTYAGICKKCEPKEFLYKDNDRWLMSRLKTRENVEKVGHDFANFYGLKLKEE